VVYTWHFGNLFIFLKIISNYEWHNKLSKSRKHIHCPLEFAKPKFLNVAIIPLLFLHSEIHE